MIVEEAQSIDEHSCGEIGGVKVTEKDEALNTFKNGLSTQVQYVYEIDPNEQISFRAVVKSSNKIETTACEIQKPQKVQPKSVSGEIEVGRTVYRRKTIGAKIRSKLSLKETFGVDMTVHEKPKKS